jgi:hypothetical protein
VTDKPFAGLGRPIPAPHLQDFKRKHVSTAERQEENGFNFIHLQKASPTTTEQPIDETPSSKPPTHQANKAKQNKNEKNKPHSNIIIK